MLKIKNIILIYKKKHFKKQQKINKTSCHYNVDADLPPNHWNFPTNNSP
jgi:hypothetical protein